MVYLLIFTCLRRPCVTTASFNEGVVLEAIALGLRRRISLTRGLKVSESTEDFKLVRF